MGQDESQGFNLEEERASLLSAVQKTSPQTLMGLTAARPSRAPAFRLPTASEIAPEELGEKKEGEEDFVEPEPSGPRDVGPLLVARVAQLVHAGDAVGAARAELELAVLEEATDDVAKAKEHAEAALKADPAMVAAHAVLRRARHDRFAPKSVLPHLQAQIAAAEGTARADLLAEEARVLAAAKEKPAVVRAAWERALAAAPGHAAALKGLDAALEEEDEARAEHLSVLAQAYAGDPKLAAWLHVERARILDEKLSRADAAWGALSRALELDSGLGPVRDACLRHAAKHRDAQALVEMLEAEARIEGDTARAARLELEAATVASKRVGDADRALALLRRAAARAPTTPSVDRRVLDDLIRLHEAAGRWADALKARKERIKLLDDPRSELHELRTMASIADRLADEGEAVLALERARVLDPDDDTTLNELDRQLEAAGRHDARAVLWVRQAASAEDGEARVRALVRAARISEEQGRADEAMAHLRAALVAAPADSEAIDTLMRLLTSKPSEPRAEELRARVAVYSQAADKTRDPARRVAYLEKIALVYDELLAEPQLAARTYEAILAIEPMRRSAIVGMESAAARAKDAALTAKAILAEAEHAGTEELRLERTARAAEVLAPVDAERAASLVEKVLEREPANASARTLQIRLHASAKRWELAVRAMSAKVEHTKEATSKVAQLVALAEVQSARLGAHGAALATLQTARKLEPKHPVVAEATLDLLESMGEDRALRDGLEALAKEARSEEERARLLLRAAEVTEHKLGDDDAATSLLKRAREAAPDDPIIGERLARIAAREDAWSTEGRSLDELDAVVAGDRTNVPALRALERRARAEGSAPRLANVLAQQAEAFTSPAAKLGALWALAALVEWQLPESEGIEPYDRILTIAPADRAAIDGALRRALARVRGGDGAMRPVAAGLLRALLPQATSDSERLSLHLAMGLLVDRPAEALDHYLAALRLDPKSLTGAVGAAHHSTERKDPIAGITAACALAELTHAADLRAKYLLEAAQLLLATEDPRLGTDRRGRAIELLERALDADPESMAIAGTLANVCTEDRRIDRLVAALRGALKRVTSPDTAVMLGAELARIARHDLRDPTVAIEALGRVREIAPKHAPTLLTLSEVYITQRAWNEAVEVLEIVANSAHDAAQKLTALCALGSIYERVLDKPSDAERVLRVAVEIDPKHVRSLRTLVRLARASGDKPRLAPLLERLGDAEESAEARRAAWVELSELRAAAGDREGAERALIEAAARAPGADTLGKLASFHRGENGQDHAALARSLEQVVSRGQALGAAEATLLATLGQLEVTALARINEGVGHLKRAIEIAPSFHEGRYHLANALTRVGAHGEATGHLLSLIVPDSRPLLSLRDPMTALDHLETSLKADRRFEEATVARELRAIGGGIDEQARTRMRQRRLAYDPSATDPIDRATLVAAVAPAPARHPLLDVGAALAGGDAKLLRVNLADQGISSRQRVPARSGHPTRALFDWVMRVLSIREAELVISDAAMLPRVLPQDVPWVVVPSGLVHQPEALQLSALGRMGARIALGIPWFEEVPPLNVGAALIAAARQVVPDYGTNVRDGDVEGLIADYSGPAASAVGRKQKKALSELAPVLESSLGPSRQDIEQMVSSLSKAEVRIAFLVSGDLLAVLDDLRALDPALAQASQTHDARALAAVLNHPLAGDVARFALSQEATRLRWRTGAIWGAPA